MLDEPIPLPVEGVLDLHTFRPQDIKEVLPAYLEACRQKGLLEVRIIHGKGRGQLRRGVEALLARLPAVACWAPASALYGGLGATIVRLKPLEPGLRR